MALGWLMNLDFAAGDGATPPPVPVTFAKGLNAPRRGNLGRYAAALVGVLIG